jgi:predicted DNA-binding WGR domain protein
MTALTLRRSDPIRNMHRYYRLDVQLDLFGAWCFIREWGRIGHRGGQSRTVPYPRLFNADSPPGLSLICNSVRPKCGDWSESGFTNRKMSDS